MRLRIALGLLLAADLLLAGYGLVAGDGLVDRLLVAGLVLVQAVPFALAIRWSRGARAAKGLAGEDLRPADAAALLAFVCAGIVDLGFLGGLAGVHGEYVVGLGMAAWGVANLWAITVAWRHRPWARAAPPTSRAPTPS